MSNNAKNLIMTHSLMINSKLFSHSDIQQSPSRKDNVSERDEHEMRHRGCLLIQTMAKELGMLTAPAATACHIYQRFFTLNSMRKFDCEIVAVASIFLSGKIEEHFKRIQNVLRSYNYARYGDNAKHFDESSEVFSPKFLSLKIENCL